MQSAGNTSREIAKPYPVRRVGKAKRAHHRTTLTERWWARRKRAFAYPASHFSRTDVDWVCRGTAGHTSLSILR